MTMGQVVQYGLARALFHRAIDLDHTVRSVARNSGLHRRTVDDVFARRKRPTLDTLTKIAHALGCRVTIETDDGQTIYSSKEE